LWQNRRRSRATLVEVRDLLERALTLDPDNVEANARLGAILSTGVENGWSNDRTSDLAVADRALGRALPADPAHYSALHGRCEWLRAKLLFEDAVRYCEGVLARYPRSVWALKEIGFSKIYLGRTEEALQAFTEADRLEPNSPQRGTWLQGAGHACLMLARYDEAIAWLRRAVVEPVSTGRGYAWLAAAYALAGNDAAARAALREFRRLWPAVTLASAYFRTIGSQRTVEQMERVRQGLRMAGLPESPDSPAPHLTDLTCRGRNLAIGR